MTISTYSIDSALQAYSRQSRMRIRTNSAPEGSVQRSSIDSVSISPESAAAAGAPDKPFYTLQEIISRKLMPLPEKPDTGENQTQDLTEESENLS